MADIITTLHPHTDENTNLYPNIKKDNIPSKAISKDKLSDDINNILNLASNIGELKPSGVDTSTNILAFTSNKGIYIGSDTGYWYYWDSANSIYVSGGVYQATALSDSTVKQIEYPLCNADVDYNVDLTNYSFTNGYIDFNTGNYIAHPTRLCSELIRITPYSFLKIRMGTSYTYSVSLAYYTCDYKGNLTYEGYKTWANGITKLFDGNNYYIRISFTGTNDINTIINDILRCQFSKFIGTNNFNSYVTEVNYTETFINSESEWNYGFPPETPDITNKKSSKLFKVIPGHKYAIRVSSQNSTPLAHNFAFTFYDSLSITQSSFSGWKPFYQAEFTCPIGYNYVSIGVTGSSFDFVNLNLSIFDVTPSDFTFNYLIKKIEYTISTRYAQGCFITGNYIFQCYSDGTVDIYDKDYNLIQSNVEIDSSYHLGLVQTYGKYSVDDEFELLYIYESTTAYVYRIERSSNNFSFTLVNQYTLPTNTGELASVFIDFDNSTVYAFSYESISSSTSLDNDTRGNLILEIFTYTTLGTYTRTNIIYYNQRFYPVQMCLKLGNYIYLVCGTSTRTAWLVSINLTTNKISKTIDLHSLGIKSTEELQCLTIDDNKMYLATTLGLYILKM